MNYFMGPHRAYRNYCKENELGNIVLLSDFYTDVAGRTFYTNDTFIEGGKLRGVPKIKEYMKSHTDTKESKL